MTLPVMGLALSSCSSSAPPPVGAAAGAIAAPAAPQGQRQLLQASIPKGIPNTSRCYTLTTERVVFKVLWVESDERSVWTQKALGIPNTCTGTKVWDDKWYWYYVPPDRTRNLMLAWKNIDAGKAGFVLIKNTPTLWLIYTSSGGPFVVPNGERFKVPWTVNGRLIEIDVRNPKNEGGWTANDIWVSFGY
jgi:hypothetical protein